MMRLDKILAHLGLGSRKEVKEWIRKGFVSVNGEIIKNDDYKVDEEEDEIIFLNDMIHYNKFIYLIMNKPKDVVSATQDRREKTVLDLIAGYAGRGLFPVGRLDKDTTGLLILSNDGRLAHQLLSPSHHVKKVYEASFSGSFQESFIDQFEAGITLEDGTVCLPASLELIKPNLAKITISEGKYHQVKRMFASVGLEVTDLKRVSFGGLLLPEDLKEGEYRPLSDLELESLKKKEVLSN